MDPVKDLTPVIQVASSPFLFHGCGRFEVQDTYYWVSEAKQIPGK